MKWYVINEFDCLCSKTESEEKAIELINELLNENGGYSAEDFVILHGNAYEYVLPAPTPIGTLRKVEK
jgi:hypothetical protein